MNQNEPVKQPFFVQFLENQIPEAQENNVITKPIMDLEQTQKAPSDRDEV
ncbi:MAG TPA: microviridin/marinostatin family tricyclic proteinase inhibitor [Chitinophagaceae bacterium]|nr:microviridin/marinostatin family tricyclic proteinase inhibitor [Chitinophagaceae bacterium]